MEGQTQPTNKLKFIESRRRLRSNNQVTLPHQKLVTAANNHDLVIIGCEDNSVKYYQTSHLLDFTSNQVQVVSDNPVNTISLSFRPTLLSVARHGYSSVLLIAGISSSTNCATLEAYDLDCGSTIGRVSLSDLGGAEITDYAWHPNYFESIVALCTSRGHLLILAINRQDKGIGIVYKNDRYGAMSCCWSPKGKNLAVGTMSGSIFRLEPIVSDNSFAFKELEQSVLNLANPKLTAEHQVIKLRWVNKNYLIAVHARANNPSSPDTVYSLVTVKPNKPYLYWTNISFENQASSGYLVHLANLTNSVICASSATGEAAAIGVLGAKEAATNKMEDWTLLIVEEEGARLELPLDANNCETRPCGVTQAVWPQGNIPILIFYTNDGSICPYAAMHSENILKLPEFQPTQTFNFTVPKQQVVSPPVVPQTPHVQPPAVQSQIVQAPVAKPLPAPQAVQPQAVQPQLAQPQIVQPASSGFGASSFGGSASFYKKPEFQQAIEDQKRKSIQETEDKTRVYLKELEDKTRLFKEELEGRIHEVREKLNFNKSYITLFDELIFLRDRFDEVLDIHNAHHDALDALRKDIDKVDLEILESFYLIEYIKSRRNGDIKKKSIDPVTLQKVNTIKAKLRPLEDKLEELNNHVDVAWEEFVRRKSNEERRVRSPDLIYKTLATNQKIINALKRKVEIKPELAESAATTIGLPTVKPPEEEHARFEEFLASRSVVPVRKPIY